MTLTLDNKQFGKLTVIELDTEKSVPKKRFWKCLCSCGNIVSILTNNLQSGNSKSCGCSIKRTPANFDDLTNKKIGKLVVIERIKMFGKKKWISYWKCRCDCGNLTSVKRTHLISQKITSCGKCNKNTPFVRSRNRSLSQGGTGIPKAVNNVLIFLRSTKEYRLWKEMSLLLATYKCQISNAEANLEVHHIISLKELVSIYSITKENYKQVSFILFNPSNAFVLTKELHQKFHILYRFYTTKEQLDEFIALNNSHYLI